MSNQNKQTNQVAGSVDAGPSVWAVDCQTGVQQGSEDDWDEHPDHQVDFNGLETGQTMQPCAVGTASLSGLFGVLYLIIAHCIRYTCILYTV